MTSLRTLFFTFTKELVLLRRDPSALIILFLMPMVLVFTMTLVQSNVLGEGEVAVDAAVLGSPEDPMTKAVVAWMEGSGGFSVSLLDAAEVTAESLKEAVTKGDYQLGLSIPKNLLHTLKEAVNLQVSQLLEGEGSRPIAAPQTPSPIELIFDPVTERRFQKSIEVYLNEMMLVFEASLKEQIANREINQLIMEPHHETRPPEPKPIQLPSPSSIDPLITVQRQTLEFPSVIQQNIPAWTLFGMFFIVLPLGGSLIRERSDGTFQRLLTMPAPYTGILLGKLHAYLLICLIQYVLMLAVGTYILPLLGTAAFTMTGAHFPAFLVALASAIAATGFGLFMGSIARSYDQLSMLGPVTIVIMAAIGGIMVPTYVMPEPMQLVSQLSPMNWALNAFLDIFVRGEGISQIGMPSFKLTLFGLGCIGYSHYRTKSFRQ